MAYNADMMNLNFKSETKIEKINEISENRVRLILNFVTNSTIHEIQAPLTNFTGNYLQNTPPKNPPLIKH